MIFSNFQKEKNYAKHHPLYGDAWGKINWDTVDNDIEPFIKQLIALPFTYPAGMSCSGSYKDHGDYLCHLKNFLHLKRSGRFTKILELSI